MRKLSLKAIFIALALLAAEIALPAQARKPVIGISTGYSSAQDKQTLRTTYTEAILKAGGLPVILPIIRDSTAANELISTIDGIIFSGGEDIQPALYGEGVWNNTVYCNSIRDESDFIYAHLALKAGIPILGICRGSQLMNVVFGGSLYQDIPSQIPGHLTHAKGAEHTIAIEEGSLLHRLYGTKSLLVNSFHHQAVKVPGRGVKVTAKAADGVVEAWEAPGVTAFQFHPEKMLRKDSSWLLVFEDFTAKCRK